MQIASLIRSEATVFLRLRREIYRSLRCRLLLLLLRLLRNLQCGTDRPRAKSRLSLRIALRHSGAAVGPDGFAIHNATVQACLSSLESGL